MSRSFLLSFLVVALALTAVPRAACAEDVLCSPSGCEALDKLVAAEHFEDTHLGIAGTPSPNVAAFRVLLAERNAAALFRDLLAHGSRAGQLYALSGLFFTEPAAFPTEVARVAKRGGTVSVFSGCIVREESIAHVLHSKYRTRIRVRAGQNLETWFAQHPESGQVDLAGGYYPLAFAGDARVAPRDGL